MLYLIVFGVIVIVSVVLRISSALGLSVPLAYGISYLTRTAELPFGRSECIQISLLTSWVLGAVLTSIFYKVGKWKNKAIN